MWPRRRTHKAVVIITFSLIIIIFMMRAHHRTATTQKHVISKSVAEKMDQKSSLSKQLWHFRDQDAEKLYLYNEVLKRSHSFNETNVSLFREELLRRYGRNFSERFIVDQGNTPVNSTVYFNLKSSKQSSYRIPAELYNHMPKIAKLKRLKKCSVVGNSGILLNSSCGKEIDASEFIFRCNAAPLQKFESDAGRKSNITSFNPSILDKRYGRIKTDDQLLQLLVDMREYRGAVWASCFSTRILMDLCLKMLYNYNITENTLVWGHPDHFLQMLEFWADRKLLRRLSTGFYFTNVAIHHCDEVHLYGFWPFAHVIDERARSVPYHYFDDEKFDFQTNRKIHYMDKEFATLVQLHQLGVIKIHRTCR